MEDISICELVTQTLVALREFGYTADTLRQKESLILRILKLHEQHGEKMYNENLVARYLNEFEERYRRGEINRKACTNRTKVAEYLSEFRHNGTISFIKRNLKNNLPHYYENLRSDFLVYEGWGEKVRKQVWNYSKPFFTWLIKEGHGDLSTVDETTVRKYLIYCSKSMTHGSLVNIQRFLKKVCVYWFEIGLLSSSCERLLSFSIPVDNKIKPAIPQAEIAATLKAIDRTTAKGRRDYAIILLATVSGFRPIDIVNLKLGNIDWQNGEIRITQTKTGNSLAMPLTTDVGEAIQDYILNGRPETELENVFLTLRAPIRKLHHIVPNTQNQRYRKKVRLPKSGFHGLRRALGSNMVAAGVPVTTVAQALGHSAISSTKQYISLNSKQLKECALGFTGIEPKRGASK
jgi:integrase/recombinase XerD